MATDKLETDDALIPSQIMTPNDHVRSTPEAPGLTADYAHLRHRLSGFDDLPESYRQHVWESLLDWRQQFEAPARTTGRSLPAPWLFVNDRDEIEMEWETPARYLLLRFPHSTVGEGEAPPLFYFRTEKPQGEETEEEGVTGMSQAPGLLAWLTGE